MPLAPEDRRRYLRHLLLAEVGEAGQERLSAATIPAIAGEDPRVERVRSEYLARAGLAPSPSCADAPSDAEPLAPGTPDDVARVAARPSLHEAGAALLGALAAVETVKQILGVGRVLGPLSGFSLAKAEERALP